MSQQHYPAPQLMRLSRPLYIDEGYSYSETYRTPELSSPGSAPDSASVVSQEDGERQLCRTHKRSCYGAVGSTSSLDFVQHGAASGYDLHGQSSPGHHLQPKESFPMTPSPDMAHSWPAQSNLTVCDLVLADQRLSYKPYGQQQEHRGSPDLPTGAGAHIWTQDDSQPTNPQHVHSSSSSGSHSDSSAQQRKADAKINERRQRRAQSGKGKGKGGKKSAYTVTVPMSVRALEPEFSHIQTKSMHAFVGRSIEERHEEARASGKVRRPMNSFMLYRSAYNALGNLLCEKVSDQKAISSFTGGSWKVETTETRQLYKDLAEIEKRGHQEAFPTWKFDPVKGKPTKRSIAMLPNESVEKEDVDDEEYDDQNLWPSSPGYEASQFDHGISLSSTASFPQPYVEAPDMAHQAPEPSAQWQQPSPSLQPPGGVQVSSFDYINVGRSAPPSLQSLASLDYYAEQITMPNSKLPGVMDVRFSQTHKPSPVPEFSARLTPLASPAPGGRRQLPSELPSQKAARLGASHGSSQSLGSGENYRHYQDFLNQHCPDLQPRTQVPSHTTAPLIVPHSVSDMASVASTTGLYQTAATGPASQSIANWDLSGLPYSSDLDFNTFLQDEAQENSEKFPSSNRR